jgi:hypothetical protein
MASSKTPDFPHAAVRPSSLSNRTSTRPSRLVGSNDDTSWMGRVGERARRGPITAACRMLLTYAFDERGLHRAEWRCRADNVRCSAVAERLGMTLEGVLREAWLSGGVFHD